MNQELRCEEAREILEPYLDGELPAVEASRLREHLERCPDCAAELELAGRIQRELRSLPEMVCPPEVIERVRQGDRGEVVPFRPRERVMGLRLAAAAALLAMAIGGGALFLRFQRQADHPTPQEIAQATAEARYALAYIGKVTRRTRLDLREDVLQKRLIEPASRGVSRSLGEIPRPSEPPSAPAGRLDKEF